MRWTLFAVWLEKRVPSAPLGDAQNAQAMSRLKSVKCAKLRAAFGEKASRVFGDGKGMLNENADGFHAVARKFCSSSAGLEKTTKRS